MGKVFRQTAASSISDRLPQAVWHYLAHTEAGYSIRALAREADLHASTVLRQVRRYESLRDDPLVDDALKALSRYFDTSSSRPEKEMPLMIQDAPYRPSAGPESQGSLKKESMRLLRRLAEAGAVLALAKDMEKGVIVREGPDGMPQRLAVVERDVAQHMALQEWIQCHGPEARVNRYRITLTGRTALKEHMAAEENRATGFAEQAQTFAHKTALQDPMRLRAALFDSPLNGLARRKGKDGQPFLPRELVTAGERLREDFELSQIAEGDKPDWEAFLATNASDGASCNKNADCPRARVEAALRDLGPGLGDVALRACCLLEGMESLEKRMGWSARSGKIVLRIALQRLRRHYNEINGGLGPKIG